MRGAITEYIKMSTTYKYELRFKTANGPWRVFDTYKSKDCPELSKDFNNYQKSTIIEKLEAVEIKTTRTAIEIPSINDTL